MPISPASNCCFIVNCGYNNITLMINSAPFAIVLNTSDSILETPSNFIRRIYNKASRFIYIANFSIKRNLCESLIESNVMLIYWWHDFFACTIDKPKLTITVNLIKRNITQNFIKSGFITIIRSNF